MSNKHLEIATLLTKSGNLDEAIEVLKVLTAENLAGNYIVPGLSMGTPTGIMIGPYKNRTLAAIHSVAMQPPPRKDSDVKWYDVQEYDHNEVKDILEDPEAYEMSSAKIVKPTKKAIKIHHEWKTKLSVLKIEGMSSAKWEDVILYPARSVFLKMDNSEVMKHNLGGDYLRNKYNSLKVQNYY